MTDEILTPQQELFCRYYTQNEALFSNATLSYAEAYDFKLDELSTERPVTKKDKKGKPIEWGESEYTRNYNLCSSLASRLRRNVKIQARITTLLSELMTDEFLDSQLMKVASQDGKLDAKVAAIREANAVKNRIVKRTDLTSGGEPVKVIGIEYLTPQKNDADKTKSEGDKDPVTTHA